jgi:hypothetical protein
VQSRSSQLHCNLQLAIDCQCCMMVSMPFFGLDILSKSRHTSIKCCAYASASCCWSERRVDFTSVRVSTQALLTVPTRASPNTRAPLNTTSIILPHSLTCAFAKAAILPERVLNHLSQCLYNQAPDLFCRVPPHSFTQSWLPRGSRIPSYGSSINIALATHSVHHVG